MPPSEMQHSQCAEDHSASVRAQELQGFTEVKSGPGLRLTRRLCAKLPGSCSACSWSRCWCPWNVCGLLIVNCVWWGCRWWCDWRWTCAGCGSRCHSGVLLRCWWWCRRCCGYLVQFLWCQCCCGAAASWPPDLPWMSPLSSNSLPVSCNAPAACFVELMIFMGSWPIELTSWAIPNTWFNVGVLTIRWVSCVVN